MTNSDLRQRAQSLTRLHDAVEAAQEDLKQAYLAEIEGRAMQEAAE